MNRFLLGLAIGATLAFAYTTHPETLAKTACIVLHHAKAMIRDVQTEIRRGQAKPSATMSTDTDDDPALRHQASNVRGPQRVQVPRGRFHYYYHNRWLSAP